MLNCQCRIWLFIQTSYYLPPVLMVFSFSLKFLKMLNSRNFLWVLGTALLCDLVMSFLSFRHLFYPFPFIPHEYTLRAYGGRPGQKLSVIQVCHIIRTILSILKKTKKKRLLLETLMGLQNMASYSIRNAESSPICIHFTNSILYYSFQ